SFLVDEARGHDTDERLRIESVPGQHGRTPLGWRAAAAGNAIVDHRDVLEAEVARVVRGYGPAHRHMAVDAASHEEAERALRDAPLRRVGGIAVVAEVVKADHALRRGAEEPEQGHGDGSGEHVRMDDVESALANDAGDGAGGRQQTPARADVEAMDANAAG